MRFLRNKLEKGKVQCRASHVFCEKLSFNFHSCCDISDMKRLLFLCSRGVVSGPMAKALFQHMGPSLLLNWEVTDVVNDDDSNDNDDD